MKQRDFKTAEVHFAEAIRLEPNNAAAHHWHALSFGAAGRMDDALVSMRRAVTLEPLSATIANSMLIFLYETRQYPAAIAEARRVVELDSTFTAAYGWLSLAQLYAGQLDSAVANAERGLRLSGRIGVRGLLLLVYAGAGRWADADRIRGEIERPTTRPSPYERAVVALVYGQPDAAVPLIEKSLLSGELLSGVLFSPGCDPQLDPLKSNPRFVAMMQKHGMRICPETSPWPVKPRRS